MKKFWLVGSLFLVGIFTLSCTIGLGKAVDTAAPELEITNPEPDSVIRDAFAISGTWTDDGEIESLTVTLKSTDSEQSYGPFNGTVVTDSEGKGTWSVKIDPLSEDNPLIDGTYVATVSITDGGGHVTKQSQQFVIDNTAPVIVLQRPSSKSTDSNSLVDSYGQTFTLQGQAADDNNVNLIEVKIYSDADCTDLLHTVSLSNVPPTIELDVAKFEEGTDNDYSKIYGSNTKNGATTKYFYCSIVAYDSAARYPIDADQSDDDKLGNATTHYYLYEDISSSILSDYKITEVYHMLNGTYVNGSSDSDRSATVKSVIETLEENTLNVGRFSLNPKNNPTFVVSGYSELKKDGSDFSNSDYNISKDASVVVEVSTGLDAISLVSDGLKVYLLPCDANGTPVSGAEKIYPASQTKSKSGTSWKIFTVISTDDGLKIGKDYVFGVEGADAKGNTIENSGKGYGFHLAPSGAAPDLIVTSPSSSTTYLKKNSSLRIQGNVSVEAGYPTVTISQGETKIWEKTYTDSDTVTQSNGKLKYDFDYTVPKEKFSQETGTSTEYYFTVKVTNEGTESSSTKTIMYDVDPPELSITTIGPVVNANSKENINGKLQVKGSVVDDYDTVNTNSLKWEISQSNGRKLEGAFVPVFNFDIDTTQLTNNAEATLKLYFADRAGNSSFYEKTYFVDQSTDKPSIKSDDETVWKKEIDDQEKLQTNINNNSNKNVFASNSQLSYIAEDDDGIARVTIALGNGTPVSQNVSGKPTSISMKYNVPNDADQYKLTFKIYDTNFECENFADPVKLAAAEADEANVNNFDSFEIWIQVAGSAPTLTVNGTPSYVTTNDTNVSSTALKTFTVTGKIAGLGPFKLNCDAATDETHTYYYRDAANSSNWIAMTNADKETIAGVDYYKFPETNDYKSTVYWKDVFKPKTGSASGKKNYTATDKWGLTRTVEFEYGVDSAAPTVTISTSTVATESSSDRFEGTAHDEGDSNLSKIEIQFTEKGGTPTDGKWIVADGTDAWYKNISFSQYDLDTGNNVFNSESEKTLHARAMDVAGNYSQIKTLNFAYDKAAPVITLTNKPESLPEASYVLNGYVTEVFGMEKATSGENKNKDGIITITQELTGKPTVTKEIGLTKDPADSSKYNFTVALPLSSAELPLADVEGSITYKIKGKDLNGKIVTVEFPANRDITAPVLTVTTPSAATFGDGAISSETTVFRGTLKEINPKNIYYQILKASETAPAKLTTSNVLANSINDWTAVDISSISVDGTHTGSWNFTASFDSNAATRDGKYKLYIQAADEGGNICDMQTIEFAVDSGDPEVEVFVIKEKYNNSTNQWEWDEANPVTDVLSGSTTIKVISGNRYKLIGTVNETSGVKAFSIKMKKNGVALTSPSINTVDNYQTWGIIDTSAITDEGVITFSVEVEDNSGRSASGGKPAVAGRKSVVEKTVIFDLADPAVGISTIENDNDWIYGTGDLYVSGTASDNSGISSISVSIDGGAAQSVAVSSPWTYTLDCSSLNETGLQAGTDEDPITNLHTMVVTVTDKCEKTNTITRKFKLDKTIPVLSGISIADTNTGSKYTNNINNVNISGRAYDGTLASKRKVKSVVVTGNNGTTASSVSQTPKAPTDTNFGKFTGKIASVDFSDGTYSFTVTATDYAGNHVEESVQVVVDKTPPVIGTPTLTWTDGTPVSGIHKVNRATLSVTPTDDNLDAVYYYVFDGSDNSKEITETSSGSGVYEDNLGATDWISLNGNAGTYSGTVSFNDGEGSIWIKVVDKAGNVTYNNTGTPLNYKVDTAAPDVCTLYSVSGDTTFTSGTKLANGKSKIEFVVNASDYDNAYSSGSHKGNDVTRIASVNLSSLGSSSLAITGVALTSGTPAAMNGRWKIEIPASEVVKLSDAVNSNIHSVKVIATDTAGNATREIELFKIKMDKTAPDPVFTSIFDADEAAGYQVNGTISLGGIVTEANTIASVKLEYLSAADTWTEVPHTNSDVGTYNWKYEGIDTTAYDADNNTDGLVLYDCNSSTAGMQVKFRITAIDEAGNSKSKEQIITVDQDTDRPKISLTNVSLSGMGVSGSTTTYAHLNNTNSLYGIASDDDGIASIYYNKREVLTGDTAPADWTGASKVTRYSDAACSTEVEDYVVGTYYVKQQITTSSSGSFSIADLPEGANEIHFWVTDTEGSTFPSENKAAPKVTGNETGAEVKTVVYLRINTDGPEISDLTFQRYDSTTSDYEKNDAGAYITKTLAELNSTYTFGGTKYTKVKVTAKVEDANGVKSVKIGNIAGTASAKGTGYYEIEVPLSSITESGPAKFTIEAEDNIPDINGKSASMKSTQSFDITIDKTAPTIKVTSHSNGAGIRTNFTLKGTVDDAKAVMKYVITDSNTLANGYDWSSSNTAVKAYRIPTGASIVSWDITFDNDVLNQNEMHDKDQKTYFIDLYGSKTLSDAANGLTKNSSGAIVTKDASGNATETLYRTNKPFYFHFYLEDELGNSRVDNTFYLSVDPQGDIPVITMNSPTVASYAYYNGTNTSDKWYYQTPNDYKNNQALPNESGKTFAKTHYKGAYTTASGRIVVTGYAEDDKTIKGLYMQIDPTYDPADGFTWVGANDPVPAGGTSGKKLSDYYSKIEDFYENVTTKGAGAKYNKTGIYIGDSASWNIKLNTQGEFNGASNANNTIAIKLFAVDEDGNVYEPGDTDILIMEIDSGAPKIGETEEFSLWQYAWTTTAAAATTKTYYTRTNYPAADAKAYLVSGCTGTGKTISAVDNENATITVDGYTYSKAFKNLKYSDDMWLNGIWWLVGSVEDESGISEVKMEKADIISSNCENQDYIIEATAKTQGQTNYRVRYPIGNDTANAYGNKSYTLSVKDYAANESDKRENSRTFTVNYDNKAPTLSTSSDASYNIVANVVNTDGFYTLGSSVTEANGESGFARTVVYFKRTATNYQNVYDVFLPKSRSSGDTTSPISPIAYSGLVEEDGLYWKTGNVTAITNNESAGTSVLTVTTNGNVHKGGIVKFGGTVYTIKDYTASSITIDGTPSSSLANTSILFGIGAVIDKSGTEGTTNSSTKISSGEGKGYWTNISGDDDFMVERVTTQGTKTIWEGNINTKNIPDGPIEIHYVVYDKAGNSAHGVVGKNASTNYATADYKVSNDNVFVANNAPMIASVTVATTFTGGDEPEYEETWYVSEKTRKVNVGTDAAPVWTEKSKSVGVRKDVVVAGNEAGTTAFMTIKDKSWVKPEIVGGNGALSYTYKIDNADAVSGGSLGNATVEGGEEYLNATDKNENKYVDGQVLTFPITTAMLNTITTNSTTTSPTTFLYTISDSTEGVTGGLKATATVLLAVNYNDQSAPKSVILPFEWNGIGTTEYSERVNNSYVVRCNVPNNNVYEGNTENGHIELSGDLPGTFTSSGTGVNDLDPKVSGKISIRGYSYDDIRLANIWIKMDSFTFTGGTAGSGTTADYVKAAAFASGAWTSYGDFATNGWKFTVFDNLTGEYETLPAADNSGYAAAHNKNLGKYYGSYFNQSGHKVYWQLDLDTEKLANLAGTDKKLYVITEQARDAASGSSKYSDTEAASATEGSEDSTLNTPYYQMDVVPYVTEVKNSLSSYKKGNWSIYARTAQGHYPIRVDETIKIFGFNLYNSSITPTVTGFTYRGNDTTAAATQKTYTGEEASDIQTDIEDHGHYIIVTNSSKTTGDLSLTVSGVSILNNSNKNDAKGSARADTAKYEGYYNRKPNGDNNYRLTDDVTFDVWTINSQAAQARDGTIIEEPVMKINPSNGMIGFAFASGADSFCMPNGTTSSYRWQSTNYANFNNITFDYDSTGAAHAIAVGLDTNAGATVYGGRMAYMNSIWGRGDKYNYTLDNFNGSNKLRIDSIGIPSGVYINGSATTESKVNPGRFKSASMKIIKHGNYRTMYLAYCDTMTGQIRFRAGTTTDISSTDAKASFGQFNDAYGYTNGTTAVNVRVNENGTGNDSAANNNNEESNWNSHRIYDADVADYSLLAGKESIAGTDTGYRAGTYVALDVVPGNNATGDVVVVVFYDGKDLWYTYRTGDKTQDANITNTTYWHTKKIFTNMGEHATIKVGPDNSIHIACFDSSSKALKYAYMSSYSATEKTATVDAYEIPGTYISMDVVKEGTNYIPYISYYMPSATVAKYAKLLDATKLTGTDSLDGCDSKDVFTGVWEVSIIPTTSSIREDKTSIGFYKNANGVAQNIKSNGTASHDADSGVCNGNGTANPVIAYAIGDDSVNYIETAQMK